MGRDGAERNGTRIDGANTGSGSNGINAGGNSNAGRTDTHAIIFCHCFSTFILSSFHSPSFPILFQQVQQQAGHKRKAPDGRNGTHAGGDSNVGRHGGRRRGQRVCLLLCFCPFYSPLLFYHSSSFPIISFSAEYNCRQARRD